VSRERQFIKRQATFRLYGPSGPYAIKDKRVQKGRLLEALRATPCEHEKGKKKISGKKESLRGQIRWYAQVMLVLSSRLSLKGGG
jgi:hypothetical protein